MPDQMIIRHNLMASNKENHLVETDENKLNEEITSNNVSIESENKLEIVSEINKSLPSINSGIAAFCIGVGVLYPFLSNEFNIDALKPKQAKPLSIDSS